MDSMSSEKKISVDLARESLMAISQCIPEVILASDGSPVKTAAAAADTVVDQNGHSRAEDYRSKLISISYMQSPAGKPSVSLVKNLGA